MTDVAGDSTPRARWVCMDCGEPGEKSPYASNTLDPEIVRQRCSSATCKQNWRMFRRVYPATADSVRGILIDEKPVAVARKTDPKTSWDAARSVTSDKIRSSQEAILVALRELGPMTDERLFARVQPDMSPSGARTRRSELVAMGMVRDSGRTETLKSGRKAIVWEATE